MSALPQPTKFIDLFCGIGGFHLAVKSLFPAAQCVLACDIDAKCREVYKTNFGLEPAADVTKLVTADMPDFDLLCAGFPCQAFSHAGRQGGFEDTRGTLFRDVCRILRDKKPAYFLLENVKNLKGHDGGKTWSTIHATLIESGYTTYPMPIVASPHHLGIPQHRERVFILGIRNDLVAGRPLKPALVLKPKATAITSILVDDAQVPAGAAGGHLSATDIQVLGLWEEFVQHFKAAGVKLPTFPLWSDDWDSTHNIDADPAWKQKFIQQNRAFYGDHAAFLGPWLRKVRLCPAFVGARRKFEWQAGAFKTEDSLWTLLFQFRPSGIRVKRATYSPALVAMTQIVCVGAKKRKLIPREVARLQSFPDSYTIHPSATVAYKQFGNSVNVEVVKRMLKFLLEEMI